MASKKSPETLVAEQAETPTVTTPEAPVEAPVAVIKAEAPVAAPEPAERPTSVRAVLGDNYLTIAERYDLDVRDLMTRNGDAPISIGTKVFLP